MDNKECEKTISDLKARIKNLEKEVTKMAELIFTMLERGEHYDC